MNSQMVMDKNTIRKMGLEALNEKLGLIGMVEFIQQFDSGYGDYTKERHNWLDELTIEDICNEIKNSMPAWVFRITESAPRISSVQLADIGEALCVGGPLINPKTQQHHRRAFIWHILYGGNSRHLSQPLRDPLGHLTGIPGLA
jgi:hypothetical protein